VSMWFKKVSYDIRFQTVPLPKSLLANLVADKLSEEITCRIRTEHLLINMWKFSDPDQPFHTCIVSGRTVQVIGRGIDYPVADRIVMDMLNVFEEHFSFIQINVYRVTAG